MSTKPDHAHALAEPAVAELVELAVAELAARGVVLKLPSRIDILPSGSLGDQREIEVSVKRDDLISPLFPGNKFRKLAPHLGHILLRRPFRVLTCGGAYSNHLYAFSSAAKVLRFSAIAVVRGERVEPLNPVLEYAESCGVILHFVSRDEYRTRTSDVFLSQLARRFGEFYLIPEGGTDPTAVRAVSLIANEVVDRFDLVATAVGTGGTVAGLASGFSSRGTAVLGVPVLRGASFLEEEVARLVPPSVRNWRLEHRFHAGGFARTTPELWEFVDAFETQTKIGVDLIYTGKMFFALDRLLRKGEHLGERVLAVHTGGVPIDTRETLRERKR